MNGEKTIDSSMNIYQKFSQINTLIFDVDGVFTNSQIRINEEGQLLRTMNTQDGLVVKKAISEGLNVAIITKGKSEGVVSRLIGLNIIDIYSNVSDKLLTFKSYIDSKQINPHECLYMGDDLSDISVLKNVGLACCPYDAVPEVLQVSQYISPYKGGHGAVRDVITRVLSAQHKWNVH